jgi:hypothetical protein
MLSLDERIEMINADFDSAEDEQVNCCECGQLIPEHEMYEFTSQEELLCGDCWYSEDALIDGTIEDAIGEPGRDY